MSSNLIKLFGIFVAVFFGMAGCQGGSETPTAAPSAALTVSGTASEGALILGKTVKLKDANGNSAVDGTTNATTGIYSIDVTDLTAPFLVTVTGAYGTYASLAQTAGTANINPMTTTVVALAAGNPDVPALFANLTPAQLHTINSNYTAKCLLVNTSLQSADVLPAGVKIQDYFTGTITAGTGMDAVFDTCRFAVDPASGITVKTKDAGAATLLTIPAAVVTANIGSVLAGTVLNSPVLAALASKYGHTTRATLDSLSTTDLEQVVRACFAVAVDLSALSPAGVADDPVIQTALRIGTPIVFENTAALTAYLASLTGLPGGSSTADMEAAAAAMTAAIGLGVPSQIAVAMPSTVSADLIGVTEIFSFGAGSEQPVLPTGTTEVGTGMDVDPGTLDVGRSALDVGTGSLPAIPGIDELPLPAIPDIDKLPLPSIGAPPFTAPAELLAMIESAISQGLSQSSGASEKQAPTRAALAAAPAAAARPPALVTQREFLIKYPEYVWYPRNRGQDFVIQCSIRVQLFQGSGGEKKWLRLIVDDGGNTAGFLNRGALVFTDDHDKGYFIGGVQVKLSTADSWVTFGGRHPGHVNAGIAPNGPNDSYLSDYNPPPATSATTFDVDYVEDGVRKTWTSEETRQFQMDEFELNPESGADWRWRLFLTKTPDHGDEHADRIRKLGYMSTKGSSNSTYYSWEYMSSDVGGSPWYPSHPHEQTVGWPMKMSRGTGGIGLHPKVQAYYSVPASETRTTYFTMNMSQEVWNVWSTESDNEFRATYSANVVKRFSVNFDKIANAPIWSTGTHGNPGAYRVLQSDGNLVIKSKDGRTLWQSGTGGRSGSFYLKMRDDGNLVIYQRVALWSTKTGGNPGAYRVMQNDGNLVIYSKDGKALWASGTHGNPGAYDEMQSNGNLLIKSKDGARVLWASGTGGHVFAYDVMQDDGNYVIYQDTGALWASGTSGNPGAYDVMQSDGNYVIYTRKQ